MSPRGQSAPGRPLPRRFYDRAAVEVAPDLLGQVLATADGRRVGVVEVEAYGGTDDPASHSYRGRTARNASMWGPPGHLYVYLSYGIHWCANVVCGPGDTPSAVLLRAAEPLDGLDAMRAARWHTQRRQTDRDLCRGPGRLGAALGLDRSQDGADLVTGDRGVRMVAGTPPPPPAVSRRIGVSAGADRPWRFCVPSSPWVSGRRVPETPTGLPREG